jgi:His/Glu/Gln/Arg/opine family amino acid ABC transporter permease subunit
MWNYLVNDIQIWALIRAARWPLYLTALSMPLAVFFGLFLALMRMSRSRLLSWPASAYIEVMRGTPLYVQLFLVYYTLPQIGNLLHTTALTLDPFPAAVICLAANYAAYEAEIHRAGLMAVDKGQREAALSIGMSEKQAFFIVTLPQAFRIILPPVINDAIAMLKDSCLASAIGVMELLKVAEGIGKNNSEVGLANMYIAAGLLYMVLSLAFYALGKFIESKLKAAGAPELHLDTIHGH